MRDYVTDFLHFPRASEYMSKTTYRNSSSTSKNSTSEKLE